MAIIKIGAYQVILDDCDFRIISSHNWRISKHKRSNYAITTINETTVGMHQLIKPTDDPTLIIDHIDDNGLNNQRDNLRLITKGDNNRRARISTVNTSGYKGVSYDPNRDKYYAYIQHNGKSINLGRWSTAEKAATAYNSKAKELFGEFARLNKFPPKDTTNIA